MRSRYRHQTRIGAPLRVPRSHDSTAKEVSHGSRYTRATTGTGTVSVKASSWVWERSPYRDATLIVHLAIADVVNDTNGNECWLTREAIAAKAHTSVPTVTRAVRKMLDDGLLTVVDEGGGRGKPTRYRFVMPKGTPLWTTRETGSICAASENRKPDQQPDHLRAETGSSDAPIRKTEVTQLTRAREADPNCVSCGGSGRFYNATAGADAPCRCTWEPEYEPSPPRATRPPASVGMPSKRKDA